MTKAEILTKMAKKVDRIANRRKIDITIGYLDQLSQMALALYVMGASDRKINSMIAFQLESE